MQKIVIHSPGAYDKLKLEEHKTPTIETDEVLVKVQASGINYADVTIRWGLYESAKEFVGWPITPGFEYAGVVDSVGSAVTKFKAGDKVCGINLFGGYASEIAVKEQFLFPLPEPMSFEEAAGFPAVFMTAYHGLFQNIVIRKGAKVLVHSASGGVGTALLQLGKVAGFEMIGVVGGTHKIELAKESGASQVIDKSKEDLWKRAEEICPEGYDVIFDANGVSTLQDSFDHLKPMGKLVCYGFHSMLPKKGGKINWLKLGVNYLKTPRFNPLKMTNANKSLVTFNLSYMFPRMDLFEECIMDLTQWMKEGKITPPKVTVYPANKVGEAHRDLESGTTTGKLVLAWT